MKYNISIIIPCRNGSNYLQEALETIHAQKMNVEIIVVDDGSIDNTAEIAETLGCIVIRHETSKGQVIGKNTGLAHASGDYILFHDHDDLLTKDSLQTFINVFSKNADIQVVNAKICDFISPDAKNRNQVIKKDPYHGCLGGSLMLKKEVFDTIGLFPENVTAGEIIDLTCRMDEHNIKVKKIDFVSSLRRIHDTNYGKTNQTKEYLDYASILRAKLGKK